MTDPSELNASEARRLIGCKELSPTELLEACISRIEAFNSEINAIVATDLKQARIEAKIAENAVLAGNALPPLHVLPIGIKDLNATKGLRTTWGSKLFENHVPTEDEALVALLMAAGGIIVGKTNTPEFGLTLTTEPVANGITRNPWNLNFSTGGSSGGAAAAVASGISPVAHATDGGGSIRIPASCCGLFGLKPSRGLTCIENDLTGSWAGMSVGHVVSQTVKDSAALLDLITLKAPHLFPLPNNRGPFLEQLHSKPTQLKIGIQSKHPFDLTIDSECLEAVQLCAKNCELLGHRVEEIGSPVNYGPVSSAMSKLINTFISRRVNARLEELGLNFETELIENSTRLIATLGSKLTAQELVSAKDDIFTAQLQLNEFHKSFDLILSPVLAKIPAELGWLDMNSGDIRNYTERFRTYSGFTSIYNGTGQPSMSIPTIRTNNGLPVGVMLTGAWGSDSQLLQLASELEKVNPWPLYSDLGPLE